MSTSAASVPTAKAMAGFTKVSIALATAGFTILTWVAVTTGICVPCVANSTMSILLTRHIMKIPSIFPIRQRAIQCHTWADSPKLAKLVWERMRHEKVPMPTDRYGETQFVAANKLVWYAVDCEILSDNKIHLYVYEMEDTFHGGIGDRISTLEVDLEDGVETQCVKEAVQAKKIDIAHDILTERKQKEWQEQVLAIVNETWPEKE